MQVHHTAGLELISAGCGRRALSIVPYLSLVNVGKPDYPGVGVGDDDRRSEEATDAGLMSGVRKKSRSLVVITMTVLEGRCARDRLVQTLEQPSAGIVTWPLLREGAVSYLAP